MIKLKALVESYDQYKNKRWVHYTSTPFLKFNPKQSHNDPSGIYLFPEEFKAKSDYWMAKKYKFIVEVPSDLMVLDLSKLTAQEGYDILKKITKTPKKLQAVFQRMKNAEAGTDKYYKNAAYPFWEFLRNEVFIGKPASWNKSFRNLGYDAIFDDTGTIHSKEDQLLILNPTRMKIINMDIRGGSGYEGVKLVSERLIKMLKQYKGHLKVERSRGYQTDNNPGLYVGYTNLPDEKWADENYRSVSFRVYPKKDHYGNPPSVIYISLAYSTPQIPYGVGAEYNTFEPDNWEKVDDLDKEIKRVLESPTKEKI
jgi:hypothetical protein